MKFIRDFNFEHKRVLVRVDFNVPLWLGKNGDIDNEEDWRIEATLPTINYLLEQKAKIILIAHFGRPNGKIVENLRLDLVKKRLEKLLARPVIKLNDCIGEEVEKQIGNMQAGDIVLLENIRFYPEEKNNDSDFAKQLADLGEIYVNDAFGTSHRAHASIIGLPKYLPNCAGLLLEKEIKFLSKILEKTEHPLVVIVGGAKISTKIKFIKNFLDKADNLLLAGALANTIISAKGFNIGKSVTEEEMIEETKKLDLDNPKLHAPVDVAVSVDSSGKTSSRISLISNVKKDEMILDIGPDTIKLFTRIISQAKMVVWNGPMGLLEVEKFSLGSREIAHAIAKNPGFSTVGGGDTVAFLEELGLLDKITHISTGGGAMLKFLAGEKLPGIEALE
ncbi:MAG: phosphoglycerate kinase [Parcubacteria group bacterium]|nr:phosphoglycerate kinase [Parcubacteria group bacterium]